MSRVYPDLTRRKADIDAMVLPLGFVDNFSLDRYSFPPTKAVPFYSFSTSLSYGAEFNEIMVIDNRMVHKWVALTQMTFPLLIQTIRLDI